MGEPEPRPRRPRDPQQDAARAAAATAVMAQFLGKLTGNVEGPDGRPGGKYEDGMPVSAHVDYLIWQATNPDNLCRLYEGWTAWI